MKKLGKCQIFFTVKMHIKDAVMHIKKIRACPTNRTGSLEKSLLVLR